MMSPHAQNNDVAHEKPADQGSGWKKYLPEKRIKGLSRRSLLLTAGCVIAADLVAVMPQLARAGVLGDEAAATVSHKKQLEKWDRDLREHIDTNYLKVEEFQIQGDTNNEDSLELVGRISLTSRARQDTAGAARALNALKEHGRCASITLEPSDNQAAMKVSAPWILEESDWKSVLEVSIPRYAVDFFSVYKDKNANKLIASASITKGAWNKVKENLETLQQVQFPQNMEAQFTVQRKDLQVPSGANAEISLQVLGTERLNLITMALQDAMETPEFKNLKSFVVRWMNEPNAKSSSSQGKDSMIITIDGTPEDLVDVAQTYMREQRVTLEGLKEMHIRVGETIFRGL